MSHDWHLFDEEKRYEVARQKDGSYLVRQQDDTRPSEDWPVRTLTAEEFDQWRSEGDNPEGLD